MREHDRALVATFMDDELLPYLRQEGISPSWFEQFLVAPWGRWTVYRYSVLIIFFAVGTFPLGH